MEDVEEQAGAAEVRELGAGMLQLKILRETFLGDEKVRVWMRGLGYKLVWQGTGGWTDCSLKK